MTPTTDHCMGRTFANRVKLAYCNVPERLQRGSASNQKQAGYHLILTHGFGSRGQIDLIDLQSNADGNFKFILTYYDDHGTKLVHAMPLVCKRASSIAIALINIFTTFGSPMISQNDNGREFYGAATPLRRGNLSDKDVDAVNSDIMRLWPSCRMVRGSPRRSSTNGSIERFNRTLEGK
jgi:hypothetical protein